MLSNEVEHRRKNIGLNVEQVQHNVETFCEITENMNVSFNQIWNFGIILFSDFFSTLKKLDMFREYNSVARRSQ